MRIRDIHGLRTRRGTPLTAEQSRISDQIFSEYCSRPEHRYRLSHSLLAALRAAANRYARHGLPPGYNARLAYRMHKKRIAKQLAIAIYGDPSEPDTQTLIDRANRMNR